MPTLEWIGKEKVINHHQDIPFKVLDYKYSYDTNGVSNNENLSENKIIRGDNLEALKALLPKYQGKIKCIYIDPPYNTGEEKWVYNDNVNHPKIKKWLGEVVGKEGEDLSRHDKWLCMIYPRLKLLNKLLSDYGTIFISIDDNEQANLKLICDEIFGPNNFIACFLWEKRTNRENRKVVSMRHDYILCYAKQIKHVNSIINMLPMTTEALQRYKNLDNDKRGAWKSDPAHAQAGHATKSQFYVLTAPNGKKHTLPNGRCWLYTKDVMQEAIDDNRIWFGKEGNGVPRIKTYLNSKERGLTPESIWFASEVSTNEKAKIDLKEMFGTGLVFDTPKPVQLIKRIIQIATDKDSIILDSFAGSGTTAHAVLDMNKEDGGNRKFILIEMEDYVETITAERVKRAIHGYSNINGTGGDFNFYNLGQPLLLENHYINENIDINKIREYIFYMETKQPLVQYKVIDNPYYLGSYNDSVYYFLYEKDKTTTLDYKFLSQIKESSESYIIYADKNLLSKDEMNEYKIVFKKIPRDIARL